MECKYIHRGVLKVRVRIRVRVKVRVRVRIGDRVMIRVSGVTARVPY